MQFTRKLLRKIIKLVYDRWQRGQTDGHGKYSTHAKFVFILSTLTVCAFPVVMGMLLIIGKSQSIDYR